MGSYDKLIEELENDIAEEYKERPMLLLAQAYLLSGDEKSAKKMVRKLLRLFPSGDYFLEADDLLKVLTDPDADVEEYRIELEKNFSPDEICRIEDSSDNETEVIEDDEEEPADSEEDLDEEGNGNWVEGSDEGSDDGGPVEEVSYVSDSGLSGMLKGSGKKKKQPPHIPENIQECFTGVIGLESVKKDLQQFYATLMFQSDRRNSNIQGLNSVAENFAVVGEIGCGKTLVGYIIAGLLYDFGVRKERDPFVISAERLAKIEIDEHETGILNEFSSHKDETVIIENVQDLFLWLSDSGAGKLISVLISLMADDVKKLSFVITGSKDALDRMFELNDSLKDKFFEIIEIPPYTMDELLKLADKEAAKKNLKITPGARAKLTERIRMEWQSPNFANVRTLDRLIDEASKKKALRYFERRDDGGEDLVSLAPEDFELEETEDNLDDLLAQIDSMAGLKQYKEIIKNRIEQEEAFRIAREKGIPRKKSDESFHMIFSGNPGTGKTTVARLTGKIYQQLGLLPRGNITVECGRDQLVGKYQGHTAPLVRQKFLEASGGVLFIDEAYSLCQGDNDTFGHEAVDALIKCMEDFRGDTMVILAGYTEPMNKLLQANPGFSSRIPKQNRVIFEDYNLDELCQIFYGMAKSAGFELEDNADALVEQLLASRSKSTDFDNARGVRNVLNEVESVVNRRMVSGDMDPRITCADLKSLMKDISDESATLPELMEQLNSLTGLSQVKAKVTEMVNSIEMNKLRSEMNSEGGSHLNSAQFRSSLNLNMVFTGNPGTGKTTVARLIGKIYQRLGVLDKDIFIEASRSDLVGQYLGETALKVDKLVDQSLGGIMFIDEAYSLYTGRDDMYGKEAINALVSNIENKRDKLMVILAGYSADMDRFMQLNPGLASRFPENGRIFFEDYTDEEMAEICLNMVSGAGRVMEPDSKTFLKEVIRKKRENAAGFDNARGVRNLVEAAVSHADSRLAARMHNGEELTKEELNMLLREDFI